MSFDRLAPHYRWMELVLAGDKLQRCRTAFLGRIEGAASVLIAGEGNGRFLVECRKRVPAARITIVDSSSRMLEAARRLLERSGLGCRGVEFVHADALNWRAGEAAHDVVVTHFFLDCFPREQLGRAVGNLASGAARGARWLLADFQAPERGWTRLRARAIHAAMYAFFRVVTRLPARRLDSPDEFLRERGFVLEERRTSEWGLLRSDFWRMRGGAG